MMSIKRVRLMGEHEVLATFNSSLLAAGLEVVDDNPDLIAIAGGDGAYLHTMRNLGFPDVPSIGINVGSLGYYQELAPQDHEKLASAIVNNRYKTEDRMLIEVASVGGDTVHTGVNDIVISRSSSQAMQVELHVGKGEFARFVGDGLIFSTPQGSTGYAASAGGAAVAEMLSAIQITPSNAHHSTIYESIRSPLVVPASTVIKLKVLEPDKRPVVVTVDGRDEAMDIRQPIIVRESAQTLRVLHLDDYDYFENLANKMVHRH